MFKLIVVLAIAICAVHAKPTPSVFAAAPLAVAPAIAPAVVTAQSSQVVARNYNALVAAPAPIVAAAPVVAAPVPYVAPAPVLAASYRVAAPALAAPYVASPYIGAPAVAAAW